MSLFTYSVKTMGCKANIYDSLVLEKELNELGGQKVEALKAYPDVYILNSCTVTEEADKQCHREVNRIKKASPKTWTVVTGCFAQVGPEKLKANSNIELVVSNEEKFKIKEIILNRFGNEQAQNLAPQTDPEIYWGQLPIGIGKTRAFLKIQEGCNDFCTYCIIPYARGKSRSVRLENILLETNRLVEGGVQEIVLTGTNIADYGKEFGLTLEDLIDALLTKTSLPRLRLTSLDPSEISDRILEHMGEGSRLMPHFHVSLQSAVSRVLRVMKRHYKQEDVISALERIYAKSSQIFVGMDIIAGFPSETNEDHKEGVKLLENLPWTRLHVFPYSEREGTPATRLSQSVPVAERKQRAQELLSLSHYRHEKFTQQFFGKKLNDVLFETTNQAGLDHFVVGHAGNYVRVVARASSQNEAQKALNQIGSVQITGAVPVPAQDWTLEANLA